MKLKIMSKEMQPETRQVVIEVMKQAEEFQDDCHKCVSAIMKDNNQISYQDAVNTWLFTKLAELQHQLN